MSIPRAALEVLATGPLALIQDLGRPGLASMGVSRSGAADRASFRLGARLLAQDYAAAAIEVTFGGLAIRATVT
jgi:allophanate hydrolase subunit 2